MTSPTPRVRLARVVSAAAAVLLAALAVTTPAANAAEKGTIVVLGDSFSTNTVNQGCEKSPTSWPRQLAERTGRPLINEACTGAAIAETDFTIGDEARKVVERGGFDENTSAVLIQLGLNDRWEGHKGGWKLLTRCVERGCDESDPVLDKITPEAYAARIKPMIDYVRYYAPNAKIAIVGYPELLPANAPDACINTLGVPVSLPNTRGLVEFLDAIQKAQAGAAKITDVEFVDAQALTKGRGLCSNAPLMAGILNPAADLFSVPFHPTPLGNTVLAKGIESQLGL
ncbi:SGNH/GDSL hydrolase family protein [Gordonia aurantiaca]|uniref:SGNH/GDSL hydrolase family protein n=1 Tax=Gordonia sp. B21 TaxID=3151852 RepID=UPI0032643DF2